MCRRLFAVAEQLQQHHEHVDKVQVQAKRAHDTRLCQPLLVAVLGVRKVGGLDVLRVIGCQTRKDQYADRRDRENQLPKLPCNLKKTNMNLVIR